MGVHVLRRSDAQSILYFIAKFRIWQNLLVVHFIRRLCHVLIETFVVVRKGCLSASALHAADGIDHFAIVGVPHLACLDVTICIFSTDLILPIVDVRIVVTKIRVAAKCIQTIFIVCVRLFLAH